MVGTYTLFKAFFKMLLFYWIMVQNRKNKKSQKFQKSFNKFSHMY